jgi:hypothetical protein
MVVFFIRNSTGNNTNTNTRVKAIKCRRSVMKKWKCREIVMDYIVSYFLKIYVSFLNIFDPDYRKICDIEKCHMIHYHKPNTCQQ